MVDLVFKSPFFINGKTQDHPRNITNDGEKDVKGQHTHKNIIQVAVVMKVDITQQNEREITEAKSCGAYYAKLDQLFKPAVMDILPGNT